MTMRPLFTVPISAVHGMLAGARRRGVATPAWTDEMLGLAGIDPALLEQDASRVTAQQYVVLFSAVKQNLQDECLGHLSRPLRRGSFVLMARSTLGAPSMEVALRRVSHAFGLLQDDVTLTCVSDASLGGLALDFSDTGTPHDDFCHEMILRVFWRLAAWLHGGKLAPRRFDFGFAQPSYAADYAEIFPAPMSFGQARSAVWFDAAAMASPVRRDVHALQTFLRATPGNLVGPHLAGQSATARVRALLQRTCPEWPRLETAAERLHMSVSALQRHLAAEGTSFQALKDQLRRDMAVVRLSTGQATLADLAAELGFTDSTAFQRAFKAWTGSTPGTYRRPDAPLKDLSRTR
ncbi:AraC family transcriptional regulator [Variovorax sp. J22R133]|uniref:AraC family transcriptional regulator n=1 Tax=Variovorax brevis TaxID=3053503 RepID=UPI0025766513|nr:AraC family transcriptional regulator [Variovorax sp. J22R133]MDM0117046.1 AraC family transcriptional regulator [Variovorax sp. J22R133]